MTFNVVCTVSIVLKIWVDVASRCGSLDQNLAALLALYLNFCMYLLTY